MAIPGMLILADNLENYNVNGWRVISKIPNKSSTGGNFSIGYIVENDSGVRGFLKALDYSEAFLPGRNTPDYLNAMTTAYMFERNLLEKCYASKLRYVVRIIDSGNFNLLPNEYPAGIVYVLPVDYLVLECADNSVRNIIDLSQAFDYAWALRSLHNVAVGIDEMHRIQIAHQDIKPSNILLFNSQNASKLGDVGRSSSLDTPARHDNCKWVGDYNYSPFEQLYGENHSDWKIRRYSCDMFMFGNLIMTYFNNVSITMAVLAKFPTDMQPGVWKDSYRTILPSIQKEFYECVDQFNSNVDTKLRDELIAMIRQLCDPDIFKRGDTSSSRLGPQQYSLQKYISRLDYWAKQYEYNLRMVIR